MTVLESSIIENIKTSLAPLFERNRIEKAILFGSYARGTSTRRSDVDIIVVLDTDKRFFERYDGFNDIESYLGTLHADLLIYTPMELASCSNRPFIRRALDEGILLYGS